MGNQCQRHHISQVLAATLFNNYIGTKSFDYLPTNLLAKCMGLSCPIFIIFAEFSYPFLFTISKYTPFYRIFFSNMFKFKFDNLFLHVLLFITCMPGWGRTNVDDSKNCSLFIIDYVLQLAIVRFYWMFADANAFLTLFLLPRFLLIYYSTGVAVVVKLNSSVDSKATLTYLKFYEQPKIDADWVRWQFLVYWRLRHLCIFIWFPCRKKSNLIKKYLLLHHIYEILLINAGGFYCLYLKFDECFIRRIHSTTESWSNESESWWSTPT